MYSGARLLLQAGVFLRSAGERRRDTPGGYDSRAVLWIMANSAGLFADSWVIPLIDSCGQNELLYKG